MKLLDNTLYAEEIALERDSIRRGVDRYKRLAADAVKRDDGAALQPAERLMAAWYSNLRDAIRTEQSECLKGIPGTGRGTYGKWLAILNAEQTAVITLHVLLGRCLREPEGVSVAQLAMSISGGICAEWNAARLTAMKGEARRDLIKSSRCRLNPRRVNTVAAKHIACGECERRDICKYALDPARWPLRARGHLGAFCIHAARLTALLPGADDNPIPAFDHFVRHSKRGHKGIGTLRLSNTAREAIDAGHTARQFLRPRHQPMLIPPARWTAVDRGGYIEVPMPFVKKTRKPSIPPSIYDAVNYLNSTPWRVNKTILAVATKLWDTGGSIAGLPPLRKREKPPRPEDWDSNPAAKRAWKAQAAQTYRHNMQEESERVNWVLKLDVAQRMADYRAIYFPHQLDFRGRAYTVPLFLNHQSDDIARGMLEFAEPVNPGDMGDYWLRIHMANCCGFDKVGFADRIKWVDENASRFQKWISDPLTHTDWTEVDKPFQALATAYALDDKAVAAHLPVQLDGSNNALQHYAAMLRDEETATLVNLIPMDAPQDFYSDVAYWAARITSQDAGNGIEIAGQLDGWVDRKLVKQTGMTVFYGVTMIGARRQLRQHLNDVGFHAERQYHASKYLAEMVMRSVGTSCPAVYAAMKWLAECAETATNDNHLLTWNSPDGFTVTQNYRSTRPVKIQTIMQHLTLRHCDYNLPVAARKQVQAFPPNFVHAIDAAHLFNTANRCEGAGIPFAGVHDSYWSHAGNIPVLNAAIREEFAALHSAPLLHDLYDQLRSRYSKLAFNPPPKTGGLDIRKVMDSDYAFC